VRRRKDCCKLLALGNSNGRHLNLTDGQGMQWANKRGIMACGGTFWAGLLCYLSSLSVAVGVIGGPLNTAPTLFDSNVYTTFLK